MKAIRKAIVALLTVVAMTVQAAPKVIVVQANQAESLLEAINEANKQNADKNAERLYILIPDGTYDLGERTLTTLRGHNVSLIGQSMERTIIVNKPDIKNEGISKTATIQNRGTGNYLQDLTLKNALDYYHSGAAGRAVCLQDKGNRTVCKRVRMLSYQDTYYSDNEDSQFYFEDCEIHGTVDFICGASDVYFNRCLLVTEKRTADGSGRNVIAAPRTSHTAWGYVFESCTVRNDVSDFQYARGWNGTPHCIWLNTTLETPEKLKSPRFDPNGMRTAKSDFREYHTMDAQGNDITPQSNVVTFTLKDEKNTIETILTKEEARKYNVKKIFTDWHPVKTVRQQVKMSEKLKRQLP